MLRQQLLYTTTLPFIKESSSFSLVAKKHPGPSSLDYSTKADCSPSGSPIGDKYIQIKTLDSGRRYRSTTNSSVEEIASAGGNISFYDPMCIYELDHGTSAGLEHMLDSLVGGRAKEEEAKLLDMPDGNFGPVVGDIWLQDLWKKRRADLNSIRFLMDSLASSISSVMLEVTSDWDGRPFKVVGYDSRICVRVSWPWVSYPGGILILAGVFFTFTSVQRKGRAMNRTVTASAA